ncbi:DNA-processing protein DprA [Runella sp.]|uniref:DNA-processing protein DprA n=1 Tax=Runella sp. TaxID=1960881 RepID=UPI003D0A2EFD
MDQRLYQLGLHLTPGLGGVLIRYLMAHFGDAQKVFEANFKTLIRVTGVGEALARTILQKEGLKTAEAELVKLEKVNGNIVFYTDVAFPQRLKSLYDAPVLLYTKGNIDFNNGRYVSLVGTRKATDYGRNITEQIVEGLVNHDVTIVSGLAYGIDISAHRASVRSHMPTIGVMATGVDVVYPDSHAKTAVEMESNGGIVTEYCLGTKPDPMRFPARNRIIAGLSDAVIVVESAKKGGGLLTAEFANNYNRDVFAVPGNLSNPYSIGPNNLISANKAQIFTGVDNLLESLSWLSNKSSVKIEVPEHFTLEESQIVSLLRQKGEMHIDNLTWESQVSTGKLATLLLNLELQGYVRSLPGKRYALG